MKPPSLFAAGIGAAALLAASVASAQAHDCRTAALEGFWRYAQSDTQCYINISADGSFRGNCRDFDWIEEREEFGIIEFRTRGFIEVDSICRLTGRFRTPNGVSNFTGRVWGITSAALEAGIVVSTTANAPGGGVLVRHSGMPETAP